MAEMEKCKSICDVYKANIEQPQDKRKIAVLKEHSREYRAKNPCGKLLTRFQVDGGIIKDKSKRKCDKALLVDEEKLYLVELKGADINTACKQLISTYEFFRYTFTQYNYFCRIILSKSPRKSCLPDKYPDSLKILQKKMNYKNNKKTIKHESTPLVEEV